MIGPVVKKELRGYFNSAIAVVFLAGFLGFAFYTFFWQEKFFARGLADLRPLFVWMPKLLIVLVSALAMRLWSDERRAGTLEVLLTLPVPRWQLVVGKFLAGLALIVIGIIAGYTVPVFLSYWWHPYRPRWNTSKIRSRYLTSNPMPWSWTVSSQEQAAEPGPLWPTSRPCTDTLGGSPGRWNLSPFAMRFWSNCRICTGSASIVGRAPTSIRPPA